MASWASITRKKHLIWGAPLSRATRIRTLKWRSQSPLPYHLAIALCVLASRFSLATCCIIYQCIYKSQPLFSNFFKNLFNFCEALIFRGKIKISLFFFLCILRWMCYNQAKYTESHRSLAGSFWSFFRHTLR